MEPERSGPPDMSGLRGRGALATLLVVLLLAIFMALVFLSSTEVVDDAYISFRYARHLAEGFGLVFNPGERVEGYSNFTWVLLAAASTRAGLDPVLTMPIVGIACALASIAVTGREAWALAASEGAVHPLSGVPAAAIVAGAPTLAYYAGNGLETALVVLLYAIGGASLVRRRPVWFAVAAVLACLSRPEGPLLAGLGFLVFAFDRPRRRALVVAVIGAAVMGPYLLWKFVYFGTIVPNTLAAKPPVLAAGVAYAGHALVGTLGLVSVVLVGRRSKRRALLLMLWGAHLLGVVAEGGDWMPGQRLLVPALPWLAMAADGPLLHLLQRPKQLGDAWRPVLLAFAATYIWASVDTFGTLRKRNSFYGYLNQVNSAIAVVLWKAGARTVAGVDIGLVAYTEPGLRMVDLSGLTDTVIGHAPGTNCNKAVPIDYVAARRPDAVLVVSADEPTTEGDHVAIRSFLYHSDASVATTPWFHENYRLRDWIRVSGTNVVYWFERAPAPLHGPRT